MLASDVSKLLKDTKDLDNFRTLVRIISAFTDVMDGVKPEEIVEMTGLPRDRCQEIAKVKTACVELVYGPDWPIPEE
jgi:hypothetical protein